MRALLVVLAVALVVSAAAAAAPVRLHVAGATSLASVLPKLDRDESYSFAGSSTLAAQVEAGAKLDVFASANTSDPAALYAKGLVAKPVVFAHNTVVIVTPPGNPAHVRSAADLKRRGVKVEIADATVALGGYTLQILRRLNLSVALGNVVGRDDDVRTVLAKVASGKVDAGLVYASDAKGAGRRVHVVQLPPGSQPNIAYAAAVVLTSPHRAAAAAFVAMLRSPRAQRALHAAGFR